MGVCDGSQGLRLAQQQSARIERIGLGIVGRVLPGNRVRKHVQRALLGSGEWNEDADHNSGPQAPI